MIETTTPGIDEGALELILKSLRDFLKDRLPEPKLLHLDENDECPLDLIRGICGPELGIQMVFIPESCNGLGGGAFDVSRLCEELARVDLGIATGVLATSLGSDPIRVGGTPEQKQVWLTRIANEGLLFAYAATEPEAGSDLAALRTSAERVLEDGNVVGYRISGRKQWISNGGIADAYTVLANTPNGPSWFIVEKGSAGFSHDNPEHKHGIRLSNTAALSFDDVYVDKDRLIGGVEGQGLQQAQAVFGYTRLMVAAFGLGAGWAALDRAIPYAKERIQAGSPLSEKQGYTHKLIVPHVVRLEASRAYIEETAERIDCGEGSLNTEGAIAKYMASESGNLAADASIQALGGYGYTHEYVVEKIKRDVRITTIYEGTSEIMEMTISRDRWQQHFKTRGQYYHEQARKLEALHSQCPRAGAEVAASALHALAEILEIARLGRLTRHQHVLLRLGELISFGECAASMCRRSVRFTKGNISDKTTRRFGAIAVAAMARIFAREAALKISEEGLRLVVGAGGVNEAELPGLESRMNVAGIRRAQAGLLEDMDYIANILFDRGVQAAAA